MLPASARLTRGEDFRQVTRRGRRAGRASMVVHALTAAGSTLSSSTGSPPTAAVPAGPRVGFVVSKAVGNSVVRHRVTRRLRHLLRERIGTLPDDCSLVVRALPAAATSSSAELAVDLDAALTRLHLLARDGTA